MRNHYITYQSACQAKNKKYFFKKCLTNKSECDIIVSQAKSEREKCLPNQDEGGERGVAVGAIVCFAAVVLLGTASIIAAKLGACTIAWVLLGLMLAANIAVQAINVYCCFAS